MYLSQKSAFCATKRNDKPWAICFHCSVYFRSLPSSTLVPWYFVFVPVSFLISHCSGHGCCSHLFVLNNEILKQKQIRKRNIKTWKVPSILECILRPLEIVIGGYSRPRFSHKINIDSNNKLFVHHFGLLSKYTGFIISVAF